jgi:hypothetical protein
MEIGPLHPHLTAVWNTKCIGRMGILPWDTCSGMHIQPGKIKINEKSYKQIYPRMSTF